MSQHDASPHPPETIHDPGSQQTLDPTPETHRDESGVSAAVNSVIVMARVNAAQKLIDDAIESHMEPEEFTRALRDIGISPNEATDYVDELEQRIRIRNEKAKALERSPSAERVDPIAAGEKTERQRRADETAWAVLTAKLAAAKNATHRDVPRAPSVQLH
ncbi:hypothetical protein H0H92_000765, partial [Tricholoma furcatifolium]